MSAFVIAVAVAVVVWLAVVGHKILVALLVQEVRGALADRLKRDIQDAVRPLPAELQETYQAEWLGELDATTDRPLKAVFMVQGFKKAARGILASDPALAAVEPGPALPRRRIPNATAEQFATILRRLAGQPRRLVPLMAITMVFAEAVARIPRYGPAAVGGTLLVLVVVLGIPFLSRRR
jgi:hypothetical protein